MDVYIVDDNRDIVDFLCYLISDLGLDAHAFLHPDDCLEFTQCRKISDSGLLITDFDLPKMNGVELHRQIKANIPNIQTVVISGRSRQHEVMGLDFLQKPFQAKQIVAWVMAATTATAM